MKNTLKSLMIASTILTGLAAGSAHAQGASEIRLCTGSKAGNYHFGGGQIREQAKGTLDVVLVPGTEGREGSIDNLEKLQRNECDAAFTQSDAFGVFSKQHPDLQLNFEEAESHLYHEVLHLICNTDYGLSKITGLKKPERVLVGPDGGGTSTTWDALVLSDKKTYGEISTSPTSGIRAVSQVAGNVNNAACMMYVAGLRAPSMMEVNEYAKTHPKLALVGTADSDLLKIKDSRGNSVYTKFTIPDGVYKALQPGTFSGAVDSVAVDAKVVVNNAYIDAHPKDYEKFLTFVARATNAIRSRVGQ